MIGMVYGAGGPVFPTLKEQRMIDAAKQRIRSQSQRGALSGTRYVSAPLTIKGCLLAISFLLAILIAASAAFNWLIG